MLKGLLCHPHHFKTSSSSKRTNMNLTIATAPRADGRTTNLGALAMRLIGEVTLGAALTMLLPADLRAECLEWNVMGKWNALQSNGGAQPTFVVVTQNGSQIAGNAYPNDLLHGRATFEGTLTGSTIKFTVFWSASSVGEYTGKRYRLRAE
ncbi:hypothetical protein IVB18_39090 [Bradyrhizobium sp. 186]|uniref:hypothetical protein n=1 Tax=Bradyrhizobium sp. 186 TaxID=2782654 RepID=UPI0020009EF0|nr:hypothetical protein [Bradyrhizobium sp. 186]UPK34103.1 hypothetical protein IVB18_39090 [Bradyrhizobium sp. 186]